MGVKAKKALKKKLLKISSSQITVSGSQNQTADFLPLEGGPARKVPEIKPRENKATVLYIGRIPHGFYEEEMEVRHHKRLRVARNKKTGKSKHFGFIEFEDPEVAKVVADCMHNYLLFERLLQVHLIPPADIKPNLWKGFNHLSKPLNWVQIQRKEHKKDSTVEDQRKMVQRELKRDQNRRKRIEAAGVDYKCPGLVGSIQPTPKKIRFDED